MNIFLFKSDGIKELDPTQCEDMGFLHAIQHCQVDQWK
jgi:hypothetical protein